MIKKYFDLLSSCDVQTFGAGGKGGQHQNKTESAVRLVHLPTGISVVCRDERSQHRNKVRCLEILWKKLTKLHEKPKPRIVSTILPGQRKIRREKKKLQSRKKQMRKRPETDGE
jgi:protein subunit release factor A